MELTTERREEIQAAIRQWVDEHGARRGDGVALAARFSDAPKSTVLRWYKQIVNAAGANPKKVSKEAAKQSKKDAKAIRLTPDKRTARRKAGLAVREVLPEPVTPEAINPMATRTAIDQVRDCIQHADNVVQYCTLEDGRIRNPTLYLKASNHMRASVESLAKIAERLNDAQRIEQVHAAIFEEISKADRDTAERILQRIQNLQETWGLR